MSLVAPYRVDLRRLRLPAACMLGGGLLLAHLPLTWGLPCPLRATTGVPCPFCGLTTSVRDTLGGHVRSGLRAAPLGLLLVVVALPLMLGIGPHRIRIPRLAALAVILGEWLFELHRFHIM